jgi:hypothetical protein
MWLGKQVRESTKQGNDKVARQMESAHRTSLAKGEVGIREKKLVPTFAEFVRVRFEPWAESVFASKPKTWLWYRVGMRRLIAFTPIAELRLNELNGESVASYVAHRKSAGLEVSSINRELQVLRRILHLAVERGAIHVVPKITMIAGENTASGLSHPKRKPSISQWRRNCLRSLAASSSTLGCDQMSALDCAGSQSRGSTVAMERFS